MKVDLIDLHWKSSDRIVAKWKTSVIINALTVGWVIAVYAGIFKSDHVAKIPILLQSALTFLHLPAYCLSCHNLLREYKILETLNKLLNDAAKNISKNEATIVHSFSQKALTIRAPHISKFVILIHLVYAVVIYSIIWFPTLYLQ